MIDISHKTRTLRMAAAEGALRMSPDTLRRIAADDLPKGNLFDVARAAGMLAAKRTPELIPHCHPVPLEALTIEFAPMADGWRAMATAKSVSRTGLEMEALTAVTVCLLTLYDLLKPLDKGMTIDAVRITGKTGGKSDPKFAPKRQYPAAILVCSDATARGEREDKSGRIIKDEIARFGMETADYKIVPDEPDAIRAAIKDWVNRGLPFVFITGGTGMGPRDITVETVRPMLDKEADGIGEAMRVYGQERTPWAMLSRSLAGSIGRTMVVCLPGSSGGCKESLAAVLPGLLHVRGMLEGDGH